MSALRSRPGHTPGAPPPALLPAGATSGSGRRSERPGGGGPGRSRRPRGASRPPGGLRGQARDGRGETGGQAAAAHRRAVAALEEKGRNRGMRGRGGDRPGGAWLNTRFRSLHSVLRGRKSTEVFNSGRDRVRWGKDRFQQRGAEGKVSAARLACISQAVSAWRVVASVGGSTFP